MSIDAISIHVRLCYHVQWITDQVMESRKNLQQQKIKENKNKPEASNVFNSFLPFCDDHCEPICNQ